MHIFCKVYKSLSYPLLCLLRDMRHGKGCCRLLLVVLKYQELISSCYAKLNIESSERSETKVNLTMNHQVGFIIDSHQEWMDCVFFHHICNLIGDSTNASWNLHVVSKFISKPYQFAAKFYILLLLVDGSYIIFQLLYVWHIGYQISFKDSSTSCNLYQHMQQDANLDQSHS